MLMQVTTLVFLFLTRIHCLKNESTPSVFSKRYGKKLLREVRELLELGFNVKVVKKMFYLIFEIFI